MKLGIMQPYFLPYIGYFQLINHLDEFIIYDNIQYTKKGWITRNRYLNNGSVEIFSINIKKDSDFLDVKDRVISEVFRDKECSKILRKIEASYKKAPCFINIYPTIEAIFNYKDDNLFAYINNSIIQICNLLDIGTKLVTSSSLDIDPAFKGKDRVISACNYIGASDYINSIGGTELYSKEEFKENSIDLKFIKSTLIPYEQVSCNSFEPYLSILDVLFNCGIEQTKNMLNEFEII